MYAYDVPILNRKQLQAIGKAQMPVANQVWKSERDQ